MRQGRQGRPCQLCKKPAQTWQRGAAGGGSGSRGGCADMCWAPPSWPTRTQVLVLCTVALRCRLAVQDALDRGLECHPPSAIVTMASPASPAAAAAAAAPIVARVWPLSWQKEGVPQPAASGLHHLLQLVHVVAIGDPGDPLLPPLNMRAATQLGAGAWVRARLPKKECVAAPPHSCPHMHHTAATKQPSQQPSQPRTCTWSMPARSRRSP